MGLGARTDTHRGSLFELSAHVALLLKKSSTGKVQQQHHLPDHQYHTQSKALSTKTKVKPPRWFSQSTSSTPAPLLRPASTSLRPSSPVPAPSSWTSSALAASPSPPSSPTHKPSLSAPAALRSFASPPVARPVLPRAALSGESRLLCLS